MRFRLPTWLLLLFIGIFLLRIPSLFEPYYYGDEMIYLVLGQAVRRGLVLYKDVHDNKPPLLYFVAALSENLFWFRAILTAWVIASTFFFWKLANTFFLKNKRIVTVATIFLAVSSSLPIFEGHIANAELFMMLPTLGAFLALSTQTTNKRLIISGLLLSVAALFKIPAAFDAFALLALIVINEYEKKAPSLKKIVLSVFVFSISFLLPLAASVLYYVLKGAGSEYLVAAFLQNIGYVSSFRPQDKVDPFWVKNAPLLIRFGLMSLSIGVLFFLKKKLSKPFVISSIWLATSLFAITLSERPYPHYFIQAIPAIALLVGLLVASKRMEQAYTVIPLWAASIVLLYYHFWYYPIPPVMTRFASLVTREVNTESYRASFGENVNQTYHLSQFIQETIQPNERIFVWKDSAPVYALSRHLPPNKYTAGYHIDDFSSLEKTLEMLTKEKPSAIILLPNAPTIPNLSTLLSKEYYLLQQIDGAEVWKKRTS